MFVLHYCGITGCLSYIIVALQDVCHTLLDYSGITVLSVSEILILKWVIADISDFG